MTTIIPIGRWRKDANKVPYLFGSREAPSRDYRELVRSRRVKQLPSRERPSQF